VQAKFNTEISYISAQLMAGKEEDKAAAGVEDADIEMEDDAPRVAGFVRETEVKTTEGAEEVKKDNPDEIEIGDDSDSEDDVVEQRVVPEGVFGSVN
jgi:hypothetical protein